MEQCDLIPLLYIVTHIAVFIVGCVIGAMIVKKDPDPWEDELYPIDGEEYE